MIDSEAIQNAEAEVASPQQPAAEGPQGVITPEEHERLIAEAEQRGYLRGRNEAITSRLDSPQLLEEPEEPEGVSILGNLRPSVW